MKKLFVLGLLGLLVACGANDQDTASEAEPTTVVEPEPTSGKL